MGGQGSLSPCFEGINSDTTCLTNTSPRFILQCESRVPAESDQGRLMKGAQNTVAKVSR